MDDRLAATRDAQAAREQPTQRPRPPDVRHVWVTTEEGRLAGLLIEWRHDHGWFGRCVFPRGRLVVEDWVPAAQLKPA